MEKNYLEKLKLQNSIRPFNYRIDATPDGAYAIRILEFYRDLCNTKWVSEESNILLEVLNKRQKCRYKELDEAIEYTKWISEESNILLEVLNKRQKCRYKELDEAIEYLKSKEFEN